MNRRLIVESLEGRALLTEIVTVVLPTVDPMIEPTNMFPTPDGPLTLVVDELYRLPPPGLYGPALQLLPPDNLLD